MGYLYLSETEDLLTPKGFSNSTSLVTVDLTHALSENFHFKSSVAFTPVAFAPSTGSPTANVTARVLRVESGLRMPLNSVTENLFELGFSARFQTMMVTQNTFGHGPTVSPLFSLTNTSVLSSDFDSEFKVESTVGYAPMKRGAPFVSMTNRELRVQVLVHWKISDLPFLLGVEYANLHFLLGDQRNFDLTLLSAGVGYAF